MKREHRDWSICEVQFLIDNYSKISPEDLVRTLKRSRPSITALAGVLGIRRQKEPKWTEEEIQYLRDNWGKCTPETLARRMGRSVNAIDVKAKRLKLGPVQDKACFTKRNICELLKVDHRKVERWVDTGLLKAKVAPTTSKSSKRKNILQVKPKDLEQFLKENPGLWDSRRAQDVIKVIRSKELKADIVQNQRKEGLQKRRVPYHLRLIFADFVIQVARSAGQRIQSARQEPDWLKSKKEQDQTNLLPREGFRWTPEEDEFLRQMFRAGNITYQKMGEHLGRSEAAVGHRLARIVIWDVPGEKGA